MLKKIAILGLGQMGMAMAENALDKGCYVYGYNRTKKKMKKNKKFLITSDVQTAIKNSSIIFLALSDDKSIAEVLFKKGKVKHSFLDKSVIIDTVTHNPEFARFMHKNFFKLNISYLDAPVSGGPDKARKGKLSIMVGGNRTDFNRYRSYIEIVAENIFYMGCPGSGQAAKLVNQILVGISQIATAEAVSLGKKYNLDKRLLLKMIDCSAGNSYIFERSAPQMFEGKFSHGFQSYLISKDLKQVLMTAKRKRLSLAMTSLASKILQQHANSKFRNIDAASVILHYQKK